MLHVEVNRANITVQPSWMVLLAALPARLASALPGTGEFFTRDGITVPPMSIEWLRQHEERSKRGVDHPG